MWILTRIKPLDHHTVAVTARPGPCPLGGGGARGSQGPPQWSPAHTLSAAARRTGAVGAQNHEPARRFGLSRKIPRVLTRFRGAVRNKPKPTNKGLTKEGGQPLGAGGREGNLLEREGRTATSWSRRAMSKRAPSKTASYKNLGTS